MSEEILHAYRLEYIVLLWGQLSLNWSIDPSQKKTGKWTLKFIWQFKEPGTAKTNLRKNSQMRGHNLKTYYKAIVFKIVCCCTKINK